MSLAQNNTGIGLSVPLATLITMKLMEYLSISQTMYGAFYGVIETSLRDVSISDIKSIFTIRNICIMIIIYTFYKLKIIKFVREKMKKYIGNKDENTLILNIYTQ